MNREKSYTKTDDFWEDCQDIKNISFNNINNSPENIKLKNIEGKINIQLRTSKYNMSKDNNTTKNSTNSNSKSVNCKKTKKNNRNFNSPCVEKMYKNLISKYPEICENIEQEKNIDKKLRCKRALLRCYGLYSYGVEIKKNIQYNKEQNDIKKTNDELSLCTFKPKINNKILNFDGKNNIVFSPKKKKKLVNNSLDKIREKKKRRRRCKNYFQANN